MRTQLGETRTVVGSLQGRIDSLEAKITAMNDKVDSARVSVENFSGASRAKPTGVRPHASEGGGTPLLPLDDESTAKNRDPEAGFTRDDSVQSYRKAMVLFQAQRYPESVLAFSAFVESYPDHALAGSAQYYVGESYFRQKEYKLALQEFKRVITSYDRSSQVSETLREMAAAEDFLKLPQDAARHRQLLTSLFPQSPAAGVPAKAAAPQEDAPEARPEAKAEMKLDPKTAAADAKTAAKAADTAAAASAAAAAAEPKIDAAMAAEHAAGVLDEPPPPTAPLDQKAGPGAK